MNTNQKKEELLSEHLIENMQKSLEEMPKEVAKQIINSMTEEEIYIRVNKRLMQEDYISDYIIFLWDVSREAFWKHVSATFDVKEGLLWGGDMPHVRKICKNEIPDFVLNNIIEFWVNYKSDFLAEYEQNTEGLACILKAQCIRFNKKEEILQYLENKYPHILDSYKIKLEYFINQKCLYSFY